MACTRSNALGVKVTDVEPRATHNTVRHIRFNFFARQRLERAANRDALNELAQLRLVQDVEEIELSDDHDLQELLIVGLEIRQHANLFEHVGRQVLRLIDDQHRAAVQRHERQQEIVKRPHQLMLTGRGQATALERFFRNDTKADQHLA